MASTLSFLDDSVTDDVIDVTDDVTSNDSHTSGFPEMFTEAMPGGRDWSAQTRRIDTYQRIMNLFILYTYVPILLIGFFGNSLSFYLLYQRAKTASTYLYLSSLCVVDNLYLSVSVLGWLISYLADIDVRNATECNLIFILNRIPKQTSAWILSAISVERTLVVYLPTKAKAICAPKVARVTLGGILLVISGFNWPAFGGHKTIRGNFPYGFDVCPPRSDAVAWYVDNVNAWVRTSLHSYIPSTLLIVTNTAMAIKFATASRNAKVKPEVTGAKAGTSGSNATSGRTMRKHSRRMTITAVLLSGSFLVFTLPQNIHFIWYSLHRVTIRGDLIKFYEFWMVRNMLGVLSQLNHATNFAFYCFTSAAFRRNMLLLVTCRLRKTSGASVTEGSTVNDTGTL